MMMGRYQCFKQRLLQPLLKLLAALHVTPDQISIFSLVLGVGFAPFFLMSDHGWSLHLAYGLLFLHLLIDGIDGPLARHLRISSSAGSFTDTVCDQIVIATTCIAMMIGWTKGFPGVSIAQGSLHLFLYTSVVAMAMVRNALHVPYYILLRPRNLVYAWLFLESYCFRQSVLAGSLEWVVIACNVVLGIKFVTGCQAIRQALAAK
jgi:phosphatidylglycerophosphate synthase